MLLAKEVLIILKEKKMHSGLHHKKSCKGKQSVERTFSADVETEVASDILYYSQIQLIITVIST